MGALINRPFTEVYVKIRQQSMPVFHTNPPAKTFTESKGASKTFIIPIETHTYSIEYWPYKRPKVRFL